MQLPHQVTLFLDPLNNKSHFIEFGIFACSSLFPFSSKPDIIVLPFQSLYFSVYSTCHHVFIVHHQPCPSFLNCSFLPSVQAFLRPLHQAKASTFPTLQLHWVHHQKTGDLHILRLQQVLVLLFSILSNKRRLKACKFILLYFPPNCEVFITKSQPKLHS